MIDWLVENGWWLVSTYLVMSFSFGVLLGKCIAFERGTDSEQDHGDRQ